MSYPQVSIIVPVYNTENYIAECITSILQQSFKDFELILVNDGSTDNSLRICEQFLDIDGRIIVQTQSNQGVTVARKQGVEIARGNYILFVDSDDTLPQESLSILVSAIKDDLDIIIGSLNNDYKRSGLIDADSFRIKCIEGDVFPGPVGKLFKRSLFDNQVFDIPKEIIKGEDMLMNVRIAFNCKDNILQLPDVVYEYRRHEGSCISRFRTNWSYEGLFYEQLFMSVCPEMYMKYLPFLVKKAMAVWHDFYGYKYILPKDYKSSKLYLLLSENISKCNSEIDILDRILFFESNRFYRFIIINIKRFIRILNH